jgi:hypothetical protein
MRSHAQRMPQLQRHAASATWESILIIQIARVIAAVEGGVAPSRRPAHTYTTTNRTAARTRNSFSGFFISVKWFCLLSALENAGTPVFSKRVCKQIDEATVMSALQDCSSQ